MSDAATPASSPPPAASEPPSPESRSSASEPPSPDSPSSGPRPRQRIAYAVLTVSLLITFAAAGYVALTSMAKDRARFENAIERTQLSIQRRLETYENLLVSGSALFTSRTTTRPNFAQFVKQIDV